MEKIIVYKSVLCNSKGKKATHHIDHFSIDNFSDIVSFTINNTIPVRMTIELAQSIGLINLDALKPYCK